MSQSISPLELGRLSIRASRIRPLLEMALNTGVSLQPALQAAGLPGSFAGSAADGTISLASFFRLQQAVSRALEDETCQLSERQLLPGTTDFVLSRLSGSNSLGEAMKVLATYYNLLHGGEFNSVRRRGSIISLCTDDRRFPYTIKNDDFIRISMECVQIYLHSMLAAISEDVADKALRRVSIVRPHGAADQPHLDFWRAPIRHGCEIYALDYDADIMARRIAMPPPEFLTASRVYEEAILLIERRERTAPRPHSAAAQVREALAQGVIDQKRAATLLDMSVATLRRRLTEEGTSFRDLRRDALNETAKALLEKRRAITDIADQLGFSDFRSFSRAFRDWNGLTPKAYQSQQDRSAT